MSSREDAAKEGKSTYEGAPCKHCGHTKRHTLNASCINCAREVAKISMRKRREYIKTLLQEGKAKAKTKA